MDDEDGSAQQEGLTSRAPEKEDIVKLCRELNRYGAKYIIVGGFAIIEAGYPRTTGDLDLLVAADVANEAKVFQALELLSDKAVRELEPGDVARYVVVRVADEIVVDLMASASGVDFEEANLDVVLREIEGVTIPFASPKLLWKMKCRTRREKDAPDLLFLRKWFLEHGMPVPGD